MILNSFFIIFAYLMGSASSAILVCRWMDLEDPRTTGSKNPGATNVLRIGGKQAATYVLAADVLKGLIPVIIAKLFGVSPLGLGLVALAAVLGHVFPVYYGFRGGKGVATAIGSFYGLSLLLGLCTSAIWLLVAFGLRYSSLASLAAVISAPFITAILPHQKYFAGLMIISLIIFIKHWGNIMRLIEGKESKIGDTSKSEHSEL